MTSVDSSVLPAKTPVTANSAPAMKPGSADSASLPPIARPCLRIRNSIALSAATIDAEPLSTDQPHASPAGTTAPSLPKANTKGCVFSSYPSGARVSVRVYSSPATRPRIASRPSPSATAEAPKTVSLPSAPTITLAASLPKRSTEPPLPSLNAPSSVNSAPPSASFESMSTLDRDTSVMASVAVTTATPPSAETAKPSGA